MRRGSHLRWLLLAAVLLLLAVATAVPARAQVFGYGSSLGLCTVDNSGNLTCPGTGAFGTLGSPGCVNLFDNTGLATKICSPSTGANITLTTPTTTGTLALVGNTTAHGLSTPFDCVAASGSGTAYTCSTSLTFVPAAGDMILFKADVASTGAATLVVNGQTGTPAINKQGGGTAIVANSLLAGQWSPMVFDGTNWQMNGLEGLAYIGRAIANTAGSAFTLDMSGATGSNAVKIPVKAGCTSGADGAVCYDSTNLNTHVRTNGADSIAATEAAAVAANAVPKATDATHGLLTASSITDNGTKISSSEFLTAGNTQRLTADTGNITATTAATGTVVFTWGALPVSTNYNFHCAGTYTQATAAGGVSIAIQGATNAPTRIDAWAALYSTNPASTTVTGTLAGTFNLTTTTATTVATVTPGATGTQFQWTLEGEVQSGASATTLNVIFFSGSSSDAVVVKAGSYCALTP